MASYFLEAEAIPYLKRVNRLNPEAGFLTLGEAYEKLGDVKTAWTYYKKALSYQFPPQTRFLKLHIERIEAGNPIYKPVVSAREPVLIDMHVHEHNKESFMPKEHIHHTETLPDDRPLSEPDSTNPPDIRAENTEKRRATAKAAQQVYDDLQKHQERTQQELQKELSDFLQWTATIMNAESPMDTNNFLMKEMEAHLKGGKAKFSPERIIRGFETMERHEQNEGMKRIQKNDPKLAEQMQRFLTKEQNPN